MAIYTVKHLLIQTVHQTFVESFDPSDNEKWLSLIDRIDPEILAEEFPDHPETASGDLSDWLKLYQLLDESEYEEREDDDWISARNGNTERSWSIADKSDKVILTGE